MDDRYSDKECIVSHDENAYDSVKTLTLQKIDAMASKVDVVAIDEGQFFPDLKEYVLKFCEEYGKTVLVAGLIADYKRDKFGCMTIILLRRPRYTFKSTMYLL